MNRVRLVLLLAGMAAAVAVPSTNSFAVSLNSTFCKNLYNRVKKEPAKRAMALSRDGKICSAYWGERTQASADKKAIAGCEENERKCSIVLR